VSITSRNEGYCEHPLLYLLDLQEETQTESCD